MNIEKEISTNKAKLVFYDNGTVEKQFFDANRANSEMNSIALLNEIFKEKHISDWKYKVVELIKYDKVTSTMTMGTVQGVEFSKILATKPEYSKHMGIWLGLYHNNAHIDENKVKRFGGFSRTNFIINEIEKEVTAIDPGDWGGENNYPEVDLVTGIYSLALGAIKAKKLPFKICNTLVKGYNSISNIAINKKQLFKSWDIVKIRFKDKYKKSHFTIRPISYIAMLVLNFYMLFILRRIEV